MGSMSWQSLWFSISAKLTSLRSAVCHVIKGCVGRPWWAIKWPGTGNKTVCIYRPFRAFHWHSHCLTRENTRCCTANTSLRVLYASATESSLCVPQSVCECMDTRRPKIECAPNYCCKHRCGKPGLPPPKSQTHHPAHSTLCVPVWEHRKSSESVCVYVRVHECVWMCICAIWYFFFKERGCADVSSSMSGLECVCKSQNCVSV